MIIVGQYPYGDHGDAKLIKDIFGKMIDVSIVLDVIFLLQKISQVTQ